MHMEHHGEPGGLQPVNGEGQAVTGNGLHAVLHQLAAVGFDAFPALCFLVHAHVGDGGVAPLVFTNAGAHIVELAARGELNGETVGALVVVILTGQQQAVDAGTAALGDDLDGGIVHGIPQVTDALVGLPPAAHDVRELLLGEAHVQGSHGDEGPGAALVAQGQLCHLALLAEGVLRAAFLDELQGDAEHLRGGCLIDFAVGAEHLQPPLLLGQP